MIKIKQSLISGSRLLQSTLFLPEKPNGAAVLFAHGYRSSSRSYSQYGKAAAKRGTICLIFDLGGHGDSQGDIDELSIADNLRDMQTAYDFLVSQPQVGSQRVGIGATSYGAYLSAILSTQRSVKKLLLRVPALYPDDLKATPRKHFDTEAVLRLAPHPTNTALRAIRSFRGKVTLVSSKHDVVILPSVINAYAQAMQNSDEHIVMEAEHVLTSDTRRVFEGVVLDWVRDL